MYLHAFLFSLLTITTVCSHNLLASNTTISEFLTLDNFENFYPSSITQGKLHDTSLDLDISNNKQFYITGQFNREANQGGGGIAANNLNITNNPGPVIFQANHTIGNGGAVYCQANCIISNNKQLCCFLGNTAGFTGSKNAGAIQAQNINISQNVGSIQFLNNSTTNYGGAVYATNDLTISMNTGEITFKNNRCILSTGSGGSIKAQTATITQNCAPITFANNYGGNHGCIDADTLMISNNDGVIKFTGNYSFSNTVGSGGGAIYCATNCNIINNRENIIFANNSSLQNAGGVYTKNLTISNNGLVLFLNNSSNWGGAVQNIQGTEQVKAMFYLSADYGDIIFNGNLNIGTNKYYRNALHSTPHLNLQIGARSGYRVAFYDPIENSHPSSSTLIFNPESYHLGTVLFSGATIPNASQQEADYTSYLRNTTNIAHGTLAVEDGACLAIYSLTQDEGFLRLGSQSIIVTTKQAGSNGTNGTTANCNLAITKLALNLPSLLKENAQAPKIWIYPNQSNNSYSEDNNPTVAISGDLTLVNDNNESPYESLDLANSITKVPFLYLCDNANKKIDVSNLNIEAINNMQHYGYQGIWSPYWEEYSTTGGTTLNTANTSHRMLYADWTATQYYIPNPKFQAPLVANSLWGNLYITRTPPPPKYLKKNNSLSPITA
ncbi:polymorphic outer membrane protein middle domain-containing protein [Chlamydia gallinacea]|uniref:polymorphic outer membrane protein middle domain-containing protein n=1 Tax=Chlamydia gallinacea TaxID=1457153 RepID=UPI0024E21451|nr:polymorphic outer membrane protein middle domain-containing protein [Chlamydia gallinacea]